MTEKLEQHHVRYKELHGEDEIVMLTISEHKRLHAELRANGAKPIPEWIIAAAHERSPKCKIRHKMWEKSEAGKVMRAKLALTKRGKAISRAASSRHELTEKRKAWHKAYAQSERGKAAQARYRAKQKELRT